MLPQIDIAGQEKLLQSTALIVGMGGLGSPVAMYLAAAGVGHLILADFDRVDLSNLQRQLLHRHSDIGRPKVESARDTLLAINPTVRVTCVAEKLDTDRLIAMLEGVDIVLDGSDNFTTRFAVNRACVTRQVPLVSGAAIRMEGQVAVFPCNQPEAPCYHCLYKEEGEEEARCSENGVLAPVVGVIGSIQATEAIKVLLNIGETLAGHLLVIDFLHTDWRKLKIRRDPHCSVCRRQ